MPSRSDRSRKPRACRSSMVRMTPESDTPRQSSATTTTVLPSHACLSRADRPGRSAWAPAARPSRCCRAQHPQLEERPTGRPGSGWPWRRGHIRVVVACSIRPELGVLRPSRTAPVDVLLSASPARRGTQRSAANSVQKQAEGRLGRKRTSGRASSCAPTATGPARPWGFHVPPLTVTPVPARATPGVAPGEVCTLVDLRSCSSPVTTVGVHLSCVPRDGCGATGPDAQDRP